MVPILDQCIQPIFVVPGSASSLHWEAVSASDQNNQWSASGAQVGTRQLPVPGTWYQAYLQVAVILLKVPAFNPKPKI